MAGVSPSVLFSFDRGARGKV